MISGRCVIVTGSTSGIGLVFDPDSAEVEAKERERAELDRLVAGHVVAYGVAKPSPFSRKPLVLRGRRRVADGVAADRERRARGRGDAAPPICIEFSGG